MYPTTETGKDPKADRDVRKHAFIQADLKKKVQQKFMCRIAEFIAESRGLLLAALTEKFPSGRGKKRLNYCPPK